MSQKEVTTMIYHRVKRSDLDSYREWQPRIAAACKEFEGFEDIQVFEPGVVTENDNEFVQVIRFQSEGLLKKWIESEQRKNLLLETESFTIGQPKLTFFTGLEHWFGQNDGPPRYKMTIVTFFAIWPLVHFLPPAINEVINIGQIGNEFLATVIIVLTMSYFALPFMCRVFRFWLKN
ncbi:MAG: hypothetical protein GKR93_02670 [Gammaproteobacteria bacterium]|nr:hypothetical protein [Gammaproteobacteria bacterium]